MSPGGIETLALALLLAAVAASLGSLSTVVAHRAGTGEGITGRSRCPRCEHRLGALDLVPVLSWCALRGRCRHCRQPISWTYPATEIAFAAVAAAVVWRHGPGWATLALAIVGLGAVMAARVDLVAQRLPNPITLVTAVGALGVFTVAAATSGVWGDLIRAVTVAAVAAVVALAVHLATRGALGEGDVKFAPLVWLGLGWLGWGAAFVGYLITAAVAFGFALTQMLRMRRWRAGRVPLGPALAAGMVLTVVLDLHWPAELRP